MKALRILAAIALALPLSFAAARPVSHGEGADFDGNGVTDARDLVAFVAQWVVDAGLSVTPTPTPTQTATVTPEPTETQTPDPTDTATPEPTDTSTPRSALTPTLTPTPLPTATDTPAPTSTPFPPTSTPRPVAGQPCPAWMHSAKHWHPAVDPDAGCYFGHEHGDEPPAWVNEFVISVDGAPTHGPRELSFDHPMNTSAAENTKKHGCMKGMHLANGEAVGPYAQLSFMQRGYPDLEVYLVYHACANPPDRLARFHSVQVFAKDRTNAVSYWRYWVDTGNPRYYLDGGSRVETSAFDIAPNNGRPILRVDWRKQTICEQWYMFGTQPRWLPDIGVTICDTATAYSDIERRLARGETTDADGAPLPDQYDATWWPTTGGNGAERNVEFVYYAFNDVLPYATGRFVWIDQFGNIMSGAGDPRCGQPVTRYGVSYTRLCTTMLIQPSLYQQISETTTFIKGQVAPREQKRYDVRGVNGPTN